MIQTVLYRQVSIIKLSQGEELISKLKKVVMFCQNTRFQMSIFP